ncbi:hypothetical protein IRY61_04210 [Candidatus Saccharibacteria bacterium]|nr:hypothetical protein [Candidatus Saccharibacteria bacterium]
MSDKEQTPTNNNVGRAVTIIIAILLIGTVWFVFGSKNQTEEPMNNTNSSEQAQEEAKDEYEGWKDHIWESQGVSFKYPGEWVISETASMGRLYIKNTEVDLLKEETPENFQQIWISVDTDENSKAREDAIKNGHSAWRVVDGEVKADTIKAGDITINTYEYNTLGGATLEAYWTDKDGKRYFATNSTEVGEPNQTEMVDVLKKLLKSVKHN